MAMHYDMSDISYEVVKEVLDSATCLKYQVCTKYPPTINFNPWTIFGAYVNSVDHFPTLMVSPCTLTHCCIAN